MIVQTRRREDICTIARTDAEEKLKRILTVYANLYPVPLKGLNIHFDDGIVIEYVPRDKKL